MRETCALLTRDELDLVLLGQIMAHICNEADIGSRSHKDLSPRLRALVRFYHLGWPICQKTFFKLHGIGMFLHYKALYYAKTGNREGQVHQCQG